MSIQITKKEANDVATKLATEFPTKIMNEYITPALNALKAMEADWSGEAAKEKLPIVEAFINDLGSLKVHVSELGAAVSKKVVSLDEGDLAAAGRGGSMLSPATANTELVKAPTAQVDPNLLKMSSVTTGAGTTISELATKINTLKTEIETEKQALSGFWKTGGEIDVILKNIDESLTELTAFEGKAKELTESIQKSQKAIEQLSQ